MSEDNKTVVRRFAEECWDKGTSTSPTNSLPKRSSATGSRSVVEGSSVSSQRSAFGTAAAGHAVKGTGTAIVRVEAGRIEEVWDNVDLFAIYTQLGVIAPLGSVAPDS